MTTVFLVNPASANGSTGKRWPEVAQLAARRGLAGEAVISERPGQLADLARRAADDGATLLVVVGGDGTVFEVANGIAGREGVEIGVVPRGTGWDFARSHGIPRRTEDALSVAAGGRAKTIDLGRARFRAWDGGERSAYFANAASVGMSGAIAARANATSKALGGKMAYAWATIAVFKRWRAAELAVQVGDERLSGRMHDVIVANGHSLAGGMKVCPDAQADDGVFDVLAIGDLTKRDLMLNMPKLYRGTHLPHPKAKLLRGATASVESAEPLPVQLDGEQPGTTPVRFEIVPAALRIRVAEAP